ncbi:MAG: hypothetical protein WKG00_28305 [Polyangiaceae bacterium]
MDTQNVTFKLFVADSASAAPHDVTRAFHRWIQERALDELLIDVADYAHVHGGPGVLLVAHEAHYGFEHGSDGRLGLKYARKRGAAGSLGERIGVALKKVVRAARLLETDPALALRFRSDELRFSIEDRLRAPNDEGTLATVTAALVPVLEAAFGVAPALTQAQRHGQAAREPFAVDVRLPGALSLEDAAKRLD